MDNKCDFTAREKYLLEYYRNQKKSSYSRLFFHYLCYIVPSLLLIVLYFNNQDLYLLYTAYGLLLAKLANNLWKAKESLEDYRNIFDKYEKKLEDSSQKKIAN
jgi:hypothetical protein